VSQRLALGLSGGGDSLALLHALRATHRDVTLHALIVDHQLRPESAREAAQAKVWADEAGATAHLLRWEAPRSGQGHARQARHRLLAEACQRLGIEALCLAHTLDDRVETLRMRASRAGGVDRMLGPGVADPSPCWPHGCGLTILRPLLGVRRADLRDYLRALGPAWIDDPTNEDLQYERIRLRQDAWPPGDAREQALLAESQAALSERRRLCAQAMALVEAAAEATPWGGFKLRRSTFAEAPRATAALALETLILAASGHQTPPSPHQTGHGLDALVSGEATTLCGAAITRDGVLGRDPGAAGRADGTRGPTPIQLSAGQTVLFDGRWRVHAHRDVIISVWGDDGQLARPVPVALRPGLVAAFDPSTGDLLALPGVKESERADFEQLAPQRIASRLLPQACPTWFDAEACARKVEVTLAKSGHQPNIRA
jgi:tRNA(Ile)-lysidine synthase